MERRPEWVDVAVFVCLLCAMYFGAMYLAIRGIQ